MATASLAPGRNQFERYRFLRGVRRGYDDPSPSAAVPRRAASGEESIVTQEERLAKRDALRSDIVKLEESIRALLEQEEELLRDCSHTYAGGKSALVGGRVRVCVHCGRSVQGKDEKLWG